jgi:peptide-methionine (S)-S-oxide reductase
MNGFLSMLGFGSRGTREFDPTDVAIAQGPDDDKPVSGHQLACFGARCFWGVELAYQRVPSVTKSEVGYSQGQMHLPTYEAVCSGQIGTLAKISSIWENPIGCVLVRASRHCGHGCFL